MRSIRRYFGELQAVISKMPDDEIERVISLLYRVWKNRRFVFILGNGGSAATASHLVNDLSKVTIVSGMPRLKALALTDNIPLVTAWANDTSYENIFREQLENLLETGDLVLAISASGNSPNIISAVEMGRERGVTTVGWTGRSGGRLKELAEYCVHSPTDDVGMIESTHMILTHLVAQELRQLILSESRLWLYIREKAELLSQDGIQNSEVRTQNV